MTGLLLFIKEKYEGERRFSGFKISIFPCCGPITFGPSLKRILSNIKQNAILQFCFSTLLSKVVRWFRISSTENFFFLVYGNLESHSHRSSYHAAISEARH